MMTKPSIDQLLELVRSELGRVPDLTGDEQREVLALADGLLGVGARRARHELAWMVEEIAQIKELAGLLGMDVPPVAADIAERYREMSALLADCVPLAMTTGGKARERLDAVIDARVAHEREIRGDVALVRG